MRLISVALGKYIINDILIDSGSDINIITKH